MVKDSADMVIDLERSEKQGRNQTPPMQLHLQYDRLWLQHISTNLASPQPLSRIVNVLLRSIPRPTSSSVRQYGFTDTPRLIIMTLLLTTSLGPNPLWIESLQPRPLLSNDTRGRKRPDYQSIGQNDISAMAVHVVKLCFKQDVMYKDRSLLRTSASDTKLASYSTPDKRFLFRSQLYQRQQQA
jgi:hypothetical protein